MKLVALALVIALVSPVGAQPDVCPACARGEIVIRKLGLEPVRALAGELASLSLSVPLSQEQYARLVAMRERTPVLVKLAAVDDDDLAAIAASLCHGTSTTCVDTTATALRCLADRCSANLPKEHRDVVALPASCHQYSTQNRSPPYGVGIDWGNGWQRSRYANDGGAWSLGIEARLRINHMFGTVARVDRVGGRDEATDTVDHNGQDDMETGSITRISVLAGPTIVLDSTRYEDTIRFVRVDLLGGYMSTRTQAGEEGPAAGIDLAYQLSSFRFGLRFVQGFGDARDASVLVGHIGFADGSRPVSDDPDDCGAGTGTRESRFALGFDIPLSGWGISSQLGYLAPGLGIEGIWHINRRFDALTHADLLLYPGYQRDRVIQDAALAGIRIDHHPSADTGYYSTVMAGYSHGVGLAGSTVGSGPVVDFSLAWGGGTTDGGGYIRLHARFGFGPDNSDYRAIFLSGGFELHFDPSSWQDRS